MLILVRRWVWLPVLICCVVVLGRSYQTLADCQVNGGFGVNGTPGNDNIVCDDNPSAPVGQPVVAGGAGGSDTITIDSSNQTNVAGDGTVAGAVVAPVGTAGNDSITINGMTSANVTGDELLDNVNGGSDTIIINGSANNVTGDSNGLNATGGSDIIVINGTATGNVSGDTQVSGGVGATYIGGADTIVISGYVAGSVIGDALMAVGNRIGGSDSITINSTAVIDNNVIGETNATVGGNDNITIAIGATINGGISGGNLAAGDFDTLLFTGSTTDTAGYNQIQAFVGCNPCSGIVTIDGSTYVFQNFEQLLNFITLIGAPVPSAPAPVVVITLDPQTPKKPTGPMTRICGDSNVIVYRLVTGEIEFYYINTPQHFLVAQVTHGALNAGQRTFAATSHTNPGWRVEISDGYFGQVFDNNNNPVGLTCRFDFP
jgi:hypothetical protein